MNSVKTILLSYFLFSCGLKLPESECYANWHCPNDRICYTQCCIPCGTEIESWNGRVTRVECVQDAEKNEPPVIVDRCENVRERLRIK